jgi:hypothetical protein
MKLLPIASFIGAVVVLLFSCKTVDVDLSKRYPNMVANADPVPAGSVDAEFDKLLSTQLSTSTVKAVFHPRLNSVALEFKYEFISYRQFWDEPARKQFAEALEKYKVDYAERKLTNRYTKSRGAYGKTEARLEYEAFKFTKNRVSYPIIDIGYRFRAKMPFFATHMREAREVDELGGSETRESSEQVIMYFTRAQAEEVVRLFDQSYLMGLIAGAEAPITGPVVLDTYTEFGD